MRLLLRCDAGPSTGVGHAVRCAAVAEAAGAAGHEVLWSGRLDGLDWLWAGLVTGPLARAQQAGLVTPEVRVADVHLGLRMVYGVAVTALDDERRARDVRAVHAGLIDRWRPGS